MDVKCPGELKCGLIAENQCVGLLMRNILGCFAITTVFSHADTVVICGSCTTVLCQPTGGKARLTEGAYHLDVLTFQHADCSIDLQAPHSAEKSKDVSTCPRSIRCIHTVAYLLSLSFCMLSSTYWCIPLDL